MSMTTSQWNWCRNSMAALEIWPDERSIMALRGRGIRLSKKVGEATPPQVEIQRSTRGSAQAVATVGHDRNRWSDSIVNRGQKRSESLVSFGRNPRSVSIGIAGQKRSEIPVSLVRNTQLNTWLNMDSCFGCLGYRSPILFCRQQLDMLSRPPSFHSVSSIPARRSSEAFLQNHCPTLAYCRRNIENLHDPDLARVLNS